MTSPDELRLIVRAAAASGDVVDVALALQAHGPRGEAARTAGLLREELDLSIPDALAIAAWAEEPGDDEQSRADLRARVKTRPRVRPV